jgi:type II secretory ATPase GspE/PulE/Tfp pilus assembly ATPase PilB-like protein
MKAASQSKQQDHPLDLIQFLKGLYEAGRINKEELQKLVKARKSPKHHVLVFIANQNIEDLKNPGKTLDLESLTQILAEQTEQDYYHVDPLSIDAAKVTEVMPLSETLQTFAEDKANLPKLRQQAYQEGMTSLRHSGALKVAAGTTTINEVFRVAPEAK